MVIKDILVFIVLFFSNKNILRIYFTWKYNNEFFKNNIMPSFSYICYL